MPLKIAPIPNDQIHRWIDSLSHLRIEVFREWPYLYDGDPEYERRYLSGFAKSPEAILIAALDGERMVGASTGSPLNDHEEAFSKPFVAAGHNTEEIFYCAESILLPEYRGKGAGHTFFDLREEHARALGFRYSAFCAVSRPTDHPSFPAGYHALDHFWLGRGYQPIQGALAHYSWKDIGFAEETEKPMQAWLRLL